MYGYINVNKLELKLKEYYEFRGFYCGLCRTLGKRHGFVSRFSLSYDMTFLIVLLTSLYEPEVKAEKKRCFVHPLHKTLVITNRFSDYASDMNLILAVEKLADDWKDEKKVQALAGIKVFKKKAEKMKKKYPRQWKTIRKELEELNRLEKEDSDDFEKIAATFGRLMGEIFVYEEDVWGEELRRMGFFLGKFIYLMDAYEDVLDDSKKGNYNPFKNIFKEKNFHEKVQILLHFTMSECAASFERLPLVKDVDILRNILYDGIWMKYDAKRKRLEGDYESI